MGIVNELSVIVVQDKTSVLKSKYMTYTHKIWGKSIYEWVLTSLGGVSYESMEIESREELLPLLKQFPSDSKYTLVLFADIPLIKHSTVVDIYEYIASADKSAIRLTNGYAYKNEYLQSIENLSSLDYVTFDEEDFITASNYKQLALISDILRNRILDYHMQNGVYFIDPSTTYVDSDVVIGSGCTVHPNNHLQGKCQIASDVILRPNNMLKNAVIKSGAVIWASVIEDSQIGCKTTVGPFSYIRNDCFLGDGCRVGDYVEIKKSKIGDGSKMAHLTYIGDAEVGEQCNIGCGVIFANYDGKNKSKTVVGNKVFIGSNCNLVAPLNIDDKAFIAAGTTVTEDVEKGKLVIGRVKQSQKDYKSNYLSNEEK